MAQLELFLGLKMSSHFPSIIDPYSEPILPDDVSDDEDGEKPLFGDDATTTSGPTKISAGAAARTERAATAAFTAATRPQSQPFSHIPEAMDSAGQVPQGATNWRRIIEYPGYRQ